MGWKYKTRNIYVGLVCGDRYSLLRSDKGVTQEKITAANSLTVSMTDNSENDYKKSDV